MVMAGFGSLAPGAVFPAVDPMAPEAYETWQDREAKAALALQQKEEADKKAAATSWYDTLNDVAHFPHRMFGALSQPSMEAPATAPAPGDRIGQARAAFATPGIHNIPSNLATSVGEAIHSGVAAPGDALAGKLPMTDENGSTSMEAVKRAFDTASLGGGASVAGTAEKTARSAGRDIRILGRKIGEDAPAPAAVAPEAPVAAALPVAPASDLASPYHTALMADSTKPGAAIAAAEHAPAFNTAIEPALGRIARKNGTPEQWRNDLAKYGVTKEEMETRGLGDLKPGQPLSKEQLAAHFQSRPVEIKAVDRVSPEWENLTPDQQYQIRDSWRDSRYPDNFANPKEYFDEVVKPNAEDFNHILGPGPKFSDYQLAVHSASGGRSADKADVSGGGKSSSAGGKKATRTKVKFGSLKPERAE